jgi:hypothetical protein
MADYSYEEKENFEGKMVKVLGPTYDPGKPEGAANWKDKLQSNEERMGYLKSALRYWYSGDWFGSEKRKQEA